jgi:hypothetical protein
MKNKKVNEQSSFAKLPMMYHEFHNTSWTETWPTVRRSGMDKEWWWLSIRLSTPVVPSGSLQGWPVEIAAILVNRFRKIPGWQTA